MTVGGAFLAASCVLLLRIQTPSSTSDGTAIRALAADYLSTQELEDLEAYLALWAPDAPGGDRRRAEVPVIFRLGDDRFSNVRIDRWAVDGDRAKVRIVADRARTVQGGNVVPSRVAIVLECVRTPDGWRILGEASGYGVLADELLALTDRTALDARLEADRQLLNRDLLRAVAERADKGALGRDFDRALAGYTLLKELATRLDEVETASTALQNVGNTHFFRHNYERALEIYRERLALEEKRGSKPDIALALQAIASAQYALNDYAAALDSYKRALAIVESLQDRLSTASISTSIGNVNFLQGDFGGAIESFARSRSLFDAMKGYVAPAARAQHGEGRAEAARGNFAAAIAAFEGALLKFQEARDRGGVPQVLGSLAHVMHLRGDHERAVEIYGQCLALEQVAGNMDGVARVLQSVGLVELVRGRFKEAVEAYTRSRTEYEKLDDRQGRAFATLGLGFAQTAIGEPAAALSSYKDASVVFEALGLREQVGRAALGTSMAHAARRAPEESLDAAVRAASIGRETGRRDLEWRARLREGYALIALGRAADARRAFEAAVAIVEDPAGLDDEEPGAPVDEDRASPHAGLAETLILLNDPRGALASGERAKLRRLRDQLNRIRDAIHRGMTGAERDDERRLAREAVSLRAQITRESGLRKPDAARLATLGERLMLATADRDAFTARLRERLPDLARWRGDLEAREIAAALALPEEQDTALVSFTASESRMLAFVSRSGDAAPAALVLPGTAREIHERPERLVAALRPRLAGAAAVVVIPEGFLWRIPFESLTTEDGPLVENARVSYAGSFTLLARINSLPVNAGVPTLTGVGTVAAASPFYSIVSIGERPTFELHQLFTTPVDATRVRIDEPPTPEPAPPIDDAAHAIQWAFAAAGVRAVTIGHLTLAPQPRVTDRSQAQAADRPQMNADKRR